MDPQRLEHRRRAGCRRTELGQGMVEYAMALTLIALVVIATITVVSRRTTAPFCSVGTALSGTHTACSADYTALVTQFGPSALYRLDEGAGTALADSSSGRLYPATASASGVTYGQAGPVVTPSTNTPDRAITLDGSGGVGTGVITIPTSPGPTPPFSGYPAGGSATYTMSFTMWFRTATPGLLLGQSSSSGYVPALYVDTSGQLRGSAFWHGVTQPPPMLAPGLYKDNTWHHVALIFDNGTETIYVDGSQANQAFGLIEQPHGGGVYTYTVGYMPSCSGWTGIPPGCRLTGSVADIAVFPTALTPAAVMTLATGR